MFVVFFFSFYPSPALVCAVIWVGFGWKRHGQSGPIKQNPIFFGLNACRGDWYRVCIYLLTRHGEFYIWEDMPGSCVCLMRQSSLSSLSWAYYAKQTLRPCFISQSFSLNNLLSEVCEAISSVSSCTCTTEEGCTWTLFSLSGSSESWQRLNWSSFCSEKRKDHSYSTGMCSIKP